MSETVDPDLRRDTPLARVLTERILTSGPITTAAYMDACLNDPEHGYYRTQTAIGGAGDFITAPEISQIFGELIGLWGATVWQLMGSPARCALVELGGGRGTLLADALRAARVLPAFRAALSVSILDQNPVLIEAQRAVLAASGVPVTWHARFEALPTGLPTIVIANEFLDTMPVRQTVSGANGNLRERRIGVDASGSLTFAGDDASVATGIAETQDFAPLIAALEDRAATAPLAALFVDYGFRGPATTDTLQAVRSHAFEHILTSPGEADLSCHVAFDAFAVDATCNGALKVDGPISQSEFLGRLGIVERASRLMAANPAKANVLEHGVARLMAPHGMGTRFLAMGLRSAGLPALPGLDEVCAAIDDILSK
jgi:NADH dehydrogenase [ubiquinone] 1 alpha subcomplex assembly factor 7